jgi:hypothetical protein
MSWNLKVQKLKYAKDTNNFRIQIYYWFMKKQDAKLKLMYPIIYHNLYNAHQNIPMQQKNIKRIWEFGGIIV